MRRLRQTSGDSGISGLLRRFQMSVGGDLDCVERAQQDLEAGLALVDVDVEGDDAKDRSRDVLQRHGGQRITYFRPWTIETLA